MSGTTLDQLLAGRAPMAPGTVHSILRQAAVQLDKAHAAGEMHGRLWPGEIVVTVAAGGAVVVEVVKFTGAASLEEAINESGQPPPFAAFASPEEILGSLKTGRSDQWAFAATAYRVLQGKNPFSGATLSELFYEICNGTPDLPADLSSAKRSTWLQGLAKDPASRHESCVRFLDELEAAFRAPAYSEPEKAPGEPTSPRAANNPQAEVVTGLPPARKRRELQTEGEGSTSNVVAEPSTAGRPVWRTIGIAAMVLVLAALGAKWIPWRPASTIPTQILETKGAAVTPPPHTTPDRTQTRLAERPKPLAPRSTAPVPEKPVLSQARRPAQTADGALSSRKVARSVVPSVFEDRSAPGRSAAVELLTYPAGATVVLDGRPETSCISPCTETVSGGRHVLLASLPGYLPAQRIFKVPEDTNLVIGLRTSSATLVITSAPRGATVIVDGRPAGRTPVTLHPPPGQHTIKAAVGTNAQQQVVNVQPEAIQGVSFSFR